MSWSWVAIWLQKLCEYNLELYKYLYVTIYIIYVR